MKTSWVVGVVMMYLGIFALEMVLTGGTVFGAQTASNVTNMATTNQSILSQPNIAESTNLFTGAWAVITHLKDYLLLWFGIFLLYSPTLFSGDMLWVWWFFCFPVDCAMGAAIVFIVRGVHSA